MSLAFRPFTDADYASRAHWESVAWPGFPTTEDSLRHEDESWPADAANHIFMIEDDGEDIGVAFWYEPFWIRAEGRYQVWFSMETEDPRQAEVLAWLLGQVAGQPAREVTTYSRTDLPFRSQVVLEAGFEEVERSPATRLDLQSFDPAPFLAQKAELEAQGIRFVDFVTLQAEGVDYARKLFDATSQMLADIPSQMAVTPIPFESYLKNLEDKHTHNPRFMHAAMVADEFVGYTRVELIHGDPTRARTGLTGVARSHRRLGLATVLKALSLQNAKAQGVTSICTDNLENNPMLEINQKLGFEHWHDIGLYRKPIG